MSTSPLRKQTHSLAHPGQRPPTSRPAPVLFWFFLILANATVVSAGEDPLKTVHSIAREFCLECHNHDGAEAHINLEGLLERPRYNTQFRQWNRIAKVIATGKMPPEEAAAPSPAQREAMSRAITTTLNRFATEHAGEPGQIVLRRLTSAEYAYTIHDLTGVALDFSHTLQDEAAGGEGFINIGDVQFLQDAALDRYLEAAKRVADHAILGSGPLQFYHAPGKTGMELSAIHRILSINRQHGFRTAAGEGGEPFGLDLYPRAFYVLWQFQHRTALGRAEATLASLAREEGISPKFATHLGTILLATDPPFPASAVARVWQALPAPTQDGNDPPTIREGCQAVYQELRRWQLRLAGGKDDDEQAAVLGTRLQLVERRTLKGNIDWEDGATEATLELELDAAYGSLSADVRVRWSRPQVVLRLQNGKRTRRVKWNDFEPRVLTAPTIGHLETNTILQGQGTLRIALQVPLEARSAEVSLQAELIVPSHESAIVRCTLRDGHTEGDTAADTGEVSTILGKATEEEERAKWSERVSQFAQQFPDASQREPAPSDRDAIPAPFDNGYNTAERNQFHYDIKYHRDDDFLVRHILDDVTGRELDIAWHDLLTSFDYHQTFLRFVAEKAGQLPDDLSITSLAEEWLDALPPELRPIAQQLSVDYSQAQAARRNAESGHLDDVLAWAERAWRRPLEVKEARQLRNFYQHLRANQGLNHDPAVRSLIARVLVSPHFLYPIAARAEDDDGRLSEWELASRLSHFLWSGPPDDALRRAAERGELSADKVLKHHVRRMLRDKKARRFTTEFFGQWFGIYRLNRYRGIDAQRFPEFDEPLRAAMLREAEASWDYITRNNRAVREILFADYTFADTALAKHYGIPAEELAGKGWQRVQHADHYHRGGLLRFGAIHAITSAPLRTSAVKRGDWILRRVLGTPVPPPPADAGSIPADDVTGDAQTVRQRLEHHRQNPSCAGCHQRMDPLGFAMEHFDPIGRYRTAYRDGQPVDAKSTLPDGTHLSGVRDLLTYLETRLDDFHRTLCSKLLGYALGRRELLSDRQLVQQLLTRLESGAGLVDLAEAIVLSPQFRHTSSPSPP